MGSKRERAAASDVVHVPVRIGSRGSQMDRRQSESTKKTRPRQETEQEPAGRLGHLRCFMHNHAVLHVDDAIRLGRELVIMCHDDERRAT